MRRIFSQIREQNSRLKLFFFVRNQYRRICTNCKVIPRHEVTTQHRMLVLDVRIKDIKPKRQNSLQSKDQVLAIQGEKARDF